MEIVYKKLLDDVVEYENTNLTKAERLVCVDYKEAVIANDVKRIEFFSAFGPSIRHRVMNVNTHQRNLMYGYSEIKLDENNWLPHGSFEHREKIEFVIPSSNKNVWHSQVTIAMSLNGKWSYGWGLITGTGSGYHFNPSVWTAAYNSRDEVYKASLQFAKTYFLGVQDKCVDFNYKLIAQNLEIIERLLNATSQPSLNFNQSKVPTYSQLTLF